MSSKADDILTAWAEFFVAHALCIREISLRMEGIAPLSVDEYDLLLTLSRQPAKRMRFKVLGEAVLYTKSGISRVFQRLEKSGYVERVTCAEDKRGAYAALTAAGEKALAASWKHYRVAILDVFGEHLQQQDARQLSAVLQKVTLGLRPDPIVRIGKSCKPGRDDDPQ